jgi:predicted signal transduction protein with EAL and GGDEF domain
MAAVRSGGCAHAYRDGDVPVTISGGLSQSTTATHHLPTLVKHADRALYLAKQRGRNRIVPFDQTDTHHDASRLINLNEHADGYHQRETSMSTYRHWP